VVREAITQAWQPFVLVTGLLLIGLVAHEDGLFAAARAALERLPGPAAVLFVGSGALVVLVTAVLNLDTAVVFLTPVLILSARARGVSEEGFLYLAVFMANAGSLFLPGSNLTNLLVLADHPLSGSQFASAFIAPALAAALVTLLGLMFMFKGSLVRGPRPGPTTVARTGWLGPGALAALTAGMLAVLLAHPAVPVLILGLGAAGHARLHGRLTTRQIVQAVSPLVLGGVFALSVVLGVLARSWDGPSTLLADAGRWQTAGIAALASVAVNNLPAAVLLSAQSIPHPRALLIGLNLGPNLAVTGSLSAYLWFQAARRSTQNLR
jgi:arsenical pump membrane protein